MVEFENIKSEKNIKSISKYILKDILFSFLSEKQKLEIIVHNKELQKKLDITIEDYKRIREIYRKGKRNRKGKEYYIPFNIMIFEGEYLNGKRNGKGKEYYINGKLRFIGEYLNGKIWNGKGFSRQCKIEFEINKENGKGKEYYFIDELRFEGEYLNGERNGKGKEYDSDGKLEFEGEYLNGERNGKGKEYHINGELRFEGEYLNRKKKIKSNIVNPKITSIRFIENNLIILYIF